MIPGYLWLYLNSPIGRGQLRGEIRTSAGNYNLSASGLGSVLIPTPPTEEQEQWTGSILVSEQSGGRLQHCGG